MIVGTTFVNGKKKLTVDRIIKRKIWTGRRVILWSAFVVIPVLGISAFYLNGSHVSKLKIERSRISLGKVSEGIFQETIPLDGTVMPLRTIFLDAVESGRIEKRFVEEGQIVEAGQVLLQLSNPDLQLELMNREELLSEERTNLKNAAYNRDKNLLLISEQLSELEFNLARAERTWRQDSILYASSVVSATEYQAARDEFVYLRRRKSILQEMYLKERENSEAQLMQYTSSVDVKQRNLGIVQNTLDMLVLRAPVRGLLTTFRGEVGEYRTKGQNLGQLDILDGFKVRASIDEHYISRIREGQAAEFDFSGKKYQLLIKVVYPQVSNSRFEADLEFIGEVPEGIRKGQSLQLRLRLGTEGKAVLIPRGAFFQNTGGNWVFVLEKDGNSAVRRNIRLGRQNPGYFEVLEGLNPGEQVILSSYETYSTYSQLEFK